MDLRVYIINRKGMEYILKYSSPYITIKFGPQNGSADWYIFNLLNTYTYGTPLLITGDEFFTYYNSSFS